MSAACTLAPLAPLASPASHVIVPLMSLSAHSTLRTPHLPHADGQRLAEAMDYARPIAQRILRAHPDHIDDVLQNAALAAFRHAGQFRGRAHYNSWFTRIVINRSLMYLRRARKDARLVSLDEPLQRARTPGEAWDLTVADLVPDPSDSPYERARTAELLDLLLAEIARMGPHVRREMALNLADSGPNDARTSTERCNRKSRKWRAVQALRAHFAKLGLRP